MTDATIAPGDMGGPHCVLVDALDRLGNLGQLRALVAAGSDGPAHFEAFAPETHALADPVAALRPCTDFFRDGLARAAA